MKNILFAFCVSLFFWSCDKEDNVRDIVIEAKVDPITGGGLTFGVVLTHNMQNISIYEELVTGSGGTFQSSQMTLDEGVTCQYEILVLGEDGNGTIGLPSDIDIKIKSDSKVIWSYIGKKGTGGNYITSGSLVIR